MSTPALTQSIVVQGNVEGSIVLGDYNFVVNNNYGTIVYKKAPPRVQRREYKPVAPRKPLGFVGRERELSDLERFIAERQAAVVCGTDGLGKTTLIKQAANGCAGHDCPDGVVYLEGIDEEGATLGLGDVTQLLFNALYDSDPPLKVDAASARTYLGNTKPLVVLDHLTFSSTALGSLSELFPQGAVLMACKRAETVSGAQSLKLGPLARAESMRLIADKAGLTVNDSNRAALDKLCALLCDVPLAIVTVANTIRERTMPLESACQMIETAKSLSADPVQAAIDGATAIVSAVVSPEERQMLAVAAALPAASVDRAWLEKVAGGPAISNGLESLGLLQANNPRLRLPPGLRTTALVGASLAITKEQLLANFLQLLPTRSLDFDFIADELGSLLGLHEWTFSQRRWADVIAIGQALDPYLTLRGLWDAWVTVLDRVLQAAQSSGNRLVEAWALHQLGTRAIGAGTRPEAISLLKQAFALRQSIGDEIGAAFTQHNLFLLLPPPPPEKPTEPPPTQPAGTPGWVLGIVGILAMAVVALSALVLPLVWPPSPTPVPTPVPPPPMFVFTTERTLLLLGECTTLRWNVQRAEWAELNEQRVRFVDEIPVCPKETTSYRLVAGGGVGASQSIQIAVQTATPPPTVQTSTPTATYTPTPTQIQSSTPMATTRIRTFTRTATPTFTRTATVTWTPPPVCPGPPVISSFNAKPSSILEGQSSTLIWGPVSNATSATIDPDIGGVGTPDSTEVRPLTNTTYTMTATGCGGTVKRQVSIFVQPLPPTISNVTSDRSKICDSGSYYFPNEQRVTITATVTDTGGVNRVVARYSGAASGEVSMSPIGGNVYRAQVGPIASDGSLSIWIVAWDNMGNSSQGGPIVVTVGICVA